MIKYIMCYTKPEEILKFVHNRNFNRYNNSLALDCDYFGILMGVLKLL